MKLPDLPKQIVKREASWTTAKAKKWCHDNLMMPWIVEVKHTRGATSLPYREIRTAQRKWSKLAIGERGGVWKPSDISKDEKPGDLFGIGSMDYWFLIKYPKGFVVVSAGRLFEEERMSKRKSLTWEGAQEIAEHIITSR